ncbi:MAG: hypothetical protein GXO46_07330 [Chlorobi bacterium]|nr:hypothetical protein [Chlorobiota bacterium]
MKSITTILLGIFCGFVSLSCRCDPDQDDPKENTETNAENKNLNKRYREADSAAVNQK